MSIKTYGRARCSTCGKNCNFEKLSQNIDGIIRFFGSCPSCRKENELIENKVCKCCQQVKPKVDFYKLPKSLSPNCKQCYKDNWRKNHPKKVKIIIKQDAFAVSPKRNAVIKKSDLTYTNKKEYFREYYRMYNKVHNAKLKKIKALRDQSNKTIDSKKPLIKSLEMKKEFSSDIFKHIKIL